MKKYCNKIKTLIIVTTMLNIHALSYASLVGQSLRPAATNISRYAAISTSLPTEVNTFQMYQYLNNPQQRSFKTMKEFIDKTKENTGLDIDLISKSATKAARKANNYVEDKTGFDYNLASKNLKKHVNDLLNNENQYESLSHKNAFEKKPRSIMKEFMDKTKENTGLDVDLISKSATKAARKANDYIEDKTGFDYNLTSKNLKKNVDDFLNKEKQEQSFASKKEPRSLWQQFNDFINK